MNAELWERVEQILADALSLPEPDRQAFAERQCGADTDTLDAVIALLDAERRMDAGYLESPVVDFSLESFGQYRALSEIGRGGMSVVYLGERIGAEFDRRAAIKVLLAPGDITQDETRILASLEHPNIARLFDAGSTSSGFRYLVMEYVDGTRIDHYCNALSRRQRLGLFLQICGGVQHANRALVVHRDLKPANILVTRDGEIKLLDFGIAKLLSAGAGSDQTVGMRAWTPDYASPEQILGEPVTASTDVYSLGVLLCELIGGMRPRTFSELSLAEIVERAGGEEIGQVPLEGELALIARKALRRDPAQRYESAGAMARDIERHLDGRPVLARTPSWTYVTRKFLWRHRIPAAAAALAVTALVTTTGVAVWQARVASQRFEQVRALARSVLFEIYGAVEPLKGSLPARELLAKRSLEYLDALSRDPRADTGMLLELARGYMRLADIEGTSGMASLGNSGAALARAEQAVDLARRALSSEPRSYEGRTVLADGLMRVSTTHVLRGATEKGIPAAREAVQLSEEVLAADPSNLARSSKAAEALHTLASAFSRTNAHLPESIPLWMKVIEIRRRSLALNPGSEPGQRDLGRAHQFAAAAFIRLGDSASAEIHARESYRLNKARLDAGHERAMLQLATDLGYLSILAWRRNDDREAARLLEEQLRLRTRLAAQEPSDSHMALSVGGSMSRLGYTYAKLGRTREALSIGVEALARQRQAYSRDKNNINATREFFFALIDLAETYGKAGRRDRMCLLVQEAQEIFSGLSKNSTPMEPGPAERLARLAKACDP